MIDDNELIQSCLAGREDAYKTLYDRYSPKLYAQCMRMTHRESVAQDALQESFINIFNHLDQFRGERPLLHWMRRITTTTSIRVLKRMDTFSFTSIDDVIIQGEDNDLVEFQLEDISYILNLVQTLPLGYSTIFNLFEIEGYSHKEIAEMLEIDEGTSRSQLYKAKRTLQRKLQGLRNKV